MNRALAIVGTAALALAGAAPVQAGELFGGLYLHDVAINRSRIEHGVDFMAGWRGGRFLPWLGGPRPHLFASVNSGGATDFAAAGIDWTIGGRLYLRPGIGIAVQDGHVHRGHDRRIPFGSPVLFEPELALGARLGPRMSIEASWVHLSHAYLAGRTNPGLDTVGLRFNLAIR